ncbi:MAG: hypothetical protein LPJ89_07560 [Hymenobacteraceae bacterium]|nr:hypothetical protein [Hymenobacteraceae bacterium]
MKNLFYTIAFSVCLGFAANAQGTSDNQVAIEQKATTMTRQMSNELGLNEMEYIKLKALNREKLKRTAEIETMYSNDPSMKMAKLKELDSNYEEQLLPLLSPKQTEAYAAYKEKSTSNIAVLQEEEEAPVIEPVEPEEE